MTSWQCWTWICPLWFDWADQPPSLCMRAAWSRTLRGCHDLAPGTLHVTGHTARCCGFPPRDSRLQFKITSSYAPHWLWLLTMVLRLGVINCLEMRMLLLLLLWECWGCSDVVTCDDAESWQVCVINQWLVSRQHFYLHLSVSNIYLASLGS